MSEIQRELVIIHSLSDSNLLSNYNAKSIDILAMAPSVMLTLDKHKISYKSTEDLYDTEDYVTDVENLKNEAEKMFSYLDEACNPILDSSFPYTGNAPYFIILFADLLYLEKLIKIIGEQYQKIVLVSHTEPKNFSWKRLKYADLKSKHGSGTIALPLLDNLEEKIGLLYKFIPMEFCFGGKQDIQRIPIIIKLKAFKEKLFYYFKKRISKFKRKKYIQQVVKYIATKKVKSQKILVIQDGYEVSILKDYLCEYSLWENTNNLRYSVNKNEPKKYDFEQIRPIIFSFLAINFPNLKNIIGEMFSTYHSEVVGRLDNFGKLFKDELKDRTIKALLFSVGVRDVFDMTMAHLANKSGIPVVFFQHGGCGVFQRTPFRKYTEITPQIKKILILNSIMELESSQHRGSICKVFGSITRYHLIKNQSKGSSTKEMLYCTSPYNISTFKSLLTNHSDKSSHIINDEILSIAEMYSVNLDIKLHPIAQNYCYNYFNELINSKGYKNSNLVYGITAESIASRYKLIILDFLGTAIVQYILSLKIPVIVYVRYFDILDNRVKEDLLKRCYVVHNREELNEIVQRYSYGDLPSKYSKEFVDKYVYPVKKDDPGIMVANYIKSIV